MSLCEKWNEEREKMYMESGIKLTAESIGN